MVQPKKTSRQGCLDVWALPLLAGLAVGGGVPHAAWGDSPAHSSPVARAESRSDTGAASPAPDGGASLSSPPAGEQGEVVDHPGALGAMDEFTGRHGLGLMLGLGSGTGLSYRHYLTDRLAVRGAGTIAYFRDTLNVWHLGALAQLDFRRDPRFVLYGIGGVAIGRALDGSGESTVLDLTLGFYPSAGVGIELGEHQASGLTYQIELALTARLRNGEFGGVFPLPQVGIHYVF